MLRGIGLLLIASCVVNVVLYAKMPASQTVSEVAQSQSTHPVKKEYTLPVEPVKKEYTLPVETKKEYVLPTAAKPVSYIPELKSMPAAPEITQPQYITPVSTQPAPKRVVTRQPGCRLNKPIVVRMPSCTKKGQPYVPPEDVQE